MNLTRVWQFACLAACATAALGQPPRAISTAALPRFEKIACSEGLAKENKTECGMLTVPENRSNPKTRAIHLPVVIFRGHAVDPPRDAVLFMAGGPGVSSVANVHSSRDVIFVEDRDYVVLEQRGARKAEPALECPEIVAPKIEINAGRLKGPEANRALANAARICRNRLVSEGADLSGYTSAATAADIEDLRRALGYDKWNLYGISYSTRLMLTVARDFPHSVRSMLLDSVLPLEVNFDDVSGANLMRSLDLLFDSCAVTTECARDHGDIRKKFFDLVEQADHVTLPLPISAGEAGGKPARIGGSEVVNAIYTALHRVDTIPSLPSIIDEASRGNDKRLTELVEQNLGVPGYSWGLRYSVWCSEEFPFEDRNLIAAQRSPALGLGGLNLGTLPPAVCDAWNVPPAPAKENQPVTSGVPTLIFAGEFDPDTPPSWGQQLIGPLSHAYFIEFRGRSHTPGFFRCGQQVAAEFFRNPDKVPAMDCVLAMRGADFAHPPPNPNPPN
jgi:pimeloyl-ACP methyl ester carboxylesterase